MTHNAKPKPLGLGFRRLWVPASAWAGEIQRIDIWRFECRTQWGVRSRSGAQYRLSGSGRIGTHKKYTPAIAGTYKKIEEHVEARSAGTSCC